MSGTMSPPERQLWPERPCNKKVAFDLEACGDNDIAGFTDEPVYRETRPLVKKSTTIEKRAGRDDMSDVQSSCGDRDATRARAAQLRVGVSVAQCSQARI
jgi:hypothetical protein